MRGKAYFCHVNILLQGITPAYAGKRFLHPRHFVGNWDHPRVCGEKPLTIALMPAPTGSPPRMRGKARLPFTIIPFLGITPAYAGKSGGNGAIYYACRDHPRVCGEKYHSSARRLSYAGSPPRMRGKDCRQGMLIVHPGITPAYAGKSKNP